MVGEMVEGERVREVVGMKTQGLPQSMQVAGMLARRSTMLPVGKREPVLEPLLVLTY